MHEEHTKELARDVFATFCRLGCDVTDTGRLAQNGSTHLDFEQRGCNMQREAAFFLSFFLSFFLLLLLLIIVIDRAIDASSVRSSLS